MSNIVNVKQWSYYELNCDNKMSDKSDVLWNPGMGEEDEGLYPVEMVEERWDWRENGDQIKIYIVKDIGI